VADSLAQRQFAHVYPQRFQVTLPCCDGLILWGGATGRAQRPCGGFGTVTAGDAGAQAAGGQHGGRNALTDSRLINEEYEAGIEGRSGKGLNNILEQDQQAIKPMIRPMPGFNLFRAAQRTVAGIKGMDIIKKGQLAGGGGHRPSPAEQFYSLGAWPSET
jgi:hypothetical protein